MKIVVYIVILLVTSSLMSAQSLAMEPNESLQAKQPTVAKFWGGAIGRNHYDSKVLRRALELTLEDFGPFELHVTEESLGVARGRREIEKGSNINVYAAPIRPKEVADTENIIIVPFAILKGLLGYRAPLVLWKQMERYSQLTTLDDLKQFRVGQGPGWIDGDIYRANGVSVVDGKYKLLFSMLAHKRFELLPLGVSEINQVVEELSEDFPDLDILPHVLLYYPFPVVYQVSGNNPELAARIEEGLKRLEASGEFDKLFEEHFSDRLERYRDGNTRLIVLTNPFLNPDIQLRNEPKLRLLDH